jgi:hypothetical protein
MLRDFEAMKSAAGSFANITLCMIRMFAEPGKDEIKIPREIINLMDGNSLNLREDADGNVYASILTRSPNLVVMNGR